MADGPIIFSNEEEEIEAVSNANLDNDSLNVLEKQQWRVLRYPQELGSSPDLKNYVVFYINVRERDTSAEYEKKIGTINLPKSQLTKQNRTVTTEAKDFKGLAGAAGAAVLGQFLGGSFLANVAAGFATSAVADNKTASEFAGKVFDSITQSVTGTSSNLQVVRLKKVIALHMNNKPSSSYQASYEDVDMGILSGILRQAGTGSDVLSKLGNIDTGSVSGFVKTSGEALAAGAAPLGALGFKNLREANILGTGSIGENISRSMAITTNPFKEQLFRNMGFRTFAFDYVFLPKSKNEALMVRNIVNTFKYYMHPGMNPANPYWLTYPAEFDISFHSYGQPNEYLHKISSCVLTNLDVDYGSDNDFMTFKPDGDESDVNGVTRSGYPTEITLKLQFTELEVLTRNRIGEGY